MKNINSITVFTFLLVAAYSCNTTSKTQDNSKFNYDDLYKVWVVDTIIDLGTDDFSTPNIEMDKNEYKFTKDDTNPNQGTRTTITPLGPSFAAPFTLEDGTINVDAMHPLLKIDEDMKLLPGSNIYGVPIPPYKIIELSPTKLTLKNKDITIKLKAK